MIIPSSLSRQVVQHQLVSSDREDQRKLVQTVREMRLEYTKDEHPDNVPSFANLSQLATFRVKNEFEDEGA